MRLEDKTVSLIMLQGVFGKADQVHNRTTSQENYSVAELICEIRTIWGQHCHTEGIWGQSQGGCKKVANVWQYLEPMNVWDAIMGARDNIDINLEDNIPGSQHPEIQEEAS